MTGVTRDFIRDEDITAGQIRERLLKISGAIRKSNQLNLTDINIICEEIFGRILNRLYDLDLTAQSANHVAVDLADYEKRIAFQVTSRTDKKKIGDTIRKFRASGLSEQIDTLNILLLNTKTYSSETVDLGNGTIFSYEDNVINLDRLVHMIEERGHDFLVEIYEIITMVFDSGRLSYSSIVAETENLSTSERLTAGSPLVWKKGYGDIQITAFLPADYQQEISCLLEIRKSDVRGAYLTFDQETLVNDYFIEESDYIARHHVGRWRGEDQIWIQMGRVRMTVDAHTAYHIYRLFMELKEAYRQAEEKIRRTPGALNMKKGKAGYCLGTLSADQWRRIWDYACAHDWCMTKGNQHENIFQVCSAAGIAIRPNLSARGRGDILAELLAETSEAGIRQKLKIY